MADTALVTTTATEQPAAPAPVFANGVKLVGEVLVPGASLLMDGKLGNGAAHAVVGLGIKAMFGPVGWLLAAADSYSKSVSDKYLWDHASELVSKARESRKNGAAAAETEAPAAVATPSKSKIA